jgi:hypothetical protein
MNCRLITSTAAIALALLSPIARADLVLSGKTTGSFESIPIVPSTATVTITNNAVTNTALFETGDPYPPSTLPTSILFQGEDFADVTSGMPIDVGLFTIHNGIDYLGSDADDAVFDLGLDLSSPSVDSFLLTKFTFDIVNTPNAPGLQPDQFGVTFNQPSPIVIDDYDVQFHVVFSPPVITVPEGGTTTRGDVYVTFTPVPEPSTYALWGAMLVGGVILYRRLGREPKGATGAA